MRLSITAFVALVLAVAPAAGQNLLANPGFDADLQGWTDNTSVENGTFTWDPNDATGGVGSVRSDNTNPSGNNGIGLEQCIPVVEGVTYSWGGAVFIPSGQGSTGTVQFNVHWHGDEGCTTTVGLGPLATSAVSDIFDTWLWRKRDNATVPAGVAAARVYVNNRKIEDGGSFEILADDLFFYETPIFADGFESGNTSAWNSP